jgi:prevent-host-death family protein
VSRQAAPKTELCAILGPMNLKADVKPITYLKNNTADVIRDVSEDGRVVMITQNGEAKVVVMDVETYDQWRKAMALLKALALGEADVSAGRVLPQKRAFKRAARAIRTAAGDE